MPKKAKSTASLPKSPSLLDLLLKYLFAALLIYVPLYPKFPVFNVPGTYVAVRAEDFLIAILAATLLLHLLLHRSYRYLFSFLVTKSILIFWAVGLLSVLSAIFVTKTAPAHLALLHWARRIEYMIPFFVALILVKDKSIIRFVSELLLPIAMIVFGYGLAQLYFNAPVISTQNEEFSKGLALTLQPGVNLSSTFAGHYDLAVYLLMVLALGTSLLFVYKNTWLKIFHLFSLLALFWLQLMTGSRIAFLATAAFVPLVLLLSKKAKLIPIVILIAFLGALNTPSLSGRFGNLLNVVKVKTIDQVKGVFHTRSLILIKPAFAIEPPAPEANENLPLRPIQQDRSTSIRLDVEWPRALRAFFKNPLLGTGYSSISLATDNDYIRSLGEVGLLGTIAWLSILLNIFSAIRKNLKKTTDPLSRQFLIGSLGLFLGFLLIATFIDVFEASKPATLFWMYAGLAVAIKNKKT